jgi:zinc-ribbon domain
VYAVTFSKLGTDTDTGQLVYLPKAARVQGLYIVGLQGMGKSGLISNLVLEDIKQGTGVCVLDPKRDLIDNIIARLPANREKDVILLDVADEVYPFGLNLFECPNLNSTRAVQIVVDQVMHIFEKLLKVSEETQLILEYLINCTITLVANQGYTMAEIPLLLTNKHCRQQLIANVNESWGESWGIDVLGFWEQYEQKQLGKQSEEIAAILRRVRRLLQPVLRPFVGQAKTTIDLQQIMDERKILLVKLDRQMPQVTTIVGSILIALILKASASRQTNRQFHLYADEFQRFATDDFATLLEEARYAAIGITMAHQNRAQLEASDKRVEEKLKDRTLNVGSLVVFYVPTDAEELAGQFDTTPPPAWEEELEEESVEVLEEEWEEEIQPEWFERVEEEVIDGEEEIKTVVSKPIEWLLSGKTHTNDRVNAFATKFLSHLDPKEFDMYRLKENTRNKLNAFLYQVMITKNPNFPIDEPVEAYGWRSVLRITPTTEDAYNKMVTDLDAKRCVQKYGYLFDPEYRSSFQGRVEGLRESDRAYRYKYASSMFASEQELIATAKGNIMYSRKQNENFFEFLISLREVMEILAEDPILERSGNYRPRTRKQINYHTHPRKTITHPRQIITHPRVAITHPQPTRAEMEKRNENQLLQLDLYQAWVKMIKNDPQNPGKKCLKCGVRNVNGARFCVSCDTKLPAPNEYIITTIEPEQGLYGKALQERIARIQVQNRKPDQFGHVYCRSRQEVEAEITQRQIGCSGGAAPAQLQQPPQPRHARQVPVPGHCPNCNATIPRGARFCNQCGARLS